MAKREGLMSFRLFFLPLGLDGLSQGNIMKCCAGYHDDVDVCEN